MCETNLSFLNEWNFEKLSVFQFLENELKVGNLIRYGVVVLFLYLFFNVTRKGQFA